MNTAICTARNSVYEILSILSTPNPADYPANSDGTPSDQAQRIQSFIDANVGTNIGVTVAHSVSDADHYVEADKATVTARPVTTCTPSATTIAADGTSTITLSGLATNTQIDITGPVASSFVNDAASEDLTFGAAGEYTITATAQFPALPTTVIISAS